MRQKDEWESKLQMRDPLICKLAAPAVAILVIVVAVLLLQIPEVDAVASLCVPLMASLLILALVYRWGVGHLSSRHR